ncbi:ankyrin repeat domain-containing protein [Wolbachia endosymbiont (group B) of Gerris lacustris]|uniref:ankyrin repeat domain-containing protein n=1 Tax=Wolbachia endosymbiont (group B) of Gerris lacustris TaxID=3066159 RepID=UPI00333E2559
MLRNRYSSVNELANEIYKSDGKLFDDIIKGVINEVYGRVDTKEILSYVRSHNNVDQSISGYVAVFDAMQRNGDLNNSAIFKLAYSIKEATSFDKYSSLDSEKRSDLKRLKSKLPESVKNIVFASKVCIKNIDHNEYLYAASNYLSYDDDRRRVFTWIPKDEKDDKFRWEIKLDGDDYSIMNVEFNEYLYGAVDYFNYDNERRKVFTWIPGGRVGRDTWKIEPIGSSCYIMNVELNEYLYAAVDHFNYDDERRRVFTWIPKNSKSDQFKWNIEDCGHAVKRRDISSSHTDLNSDTTRSSRKAELDKELLSATKIGNLSEVKNLVNQGASVDAEDKDGNTPFHNAALKGYLTIAQYLVEKGVDVNASNEDGWTPMHGSALKGHLEVVRFLIEKGANISAENIFGEKPIHCAAKRNNKDIIEVLLRKGASINDADKNGRTPLYFASWNGYLGLVEYFVRDKKANINIKDKYGKTPLDVAIDRNHISVIGYLSKKQLELCKELLVVVQSGDLSKVQDLVNQGASLDIQSEDGLTLLHFAFINNRLDIAGYLIKEGVDINVRDNDGATCLHYVSRFGRLNAVKYLISKGADIDAEDSNDRTPLDVADSSIIKILRQAHLDKELLITVQSSDLERIKSLIAQGVSKDEHGAYYFAWIGNLGTVKFIVENEGGVNVTDKYGCTLLHWAARGGHLEIVKFLLEKGANINARSILGRTPIHVAAINNRKNIVEFFISKGADINDADKDGWTPLHWAASRGNLEVTKFLVEKGANINAENVFGRKPIHRAAEDNHKNIIDFLLSKGVSVDDADKQGHTPLYWASWGGHLDMVKYLIGKGADINAKDKDGKTPLGIARDKGYNNIVNYLEEELNKEREKPVQRKRRHHHGDHARHHMSRKPLAIDSSNQPEVAASSGTRPSSWINNCISWAKKLAASTFSIIPALPSQYNVADKNNVKSDNKNIPQSTASVGWNKFLNNENIALASCVADALDNTPSRRYQGLMSKGVEVVPSSRVAVEFALKKFNSFVEDKIRNLESKEQARIRVELKDAYPEIIASLERGVEFSGNVGLDKVLEKSKKRFCTNVLQKDKVSTCLSGVRVTKLENNLSR